MARPKAFDTIATLDAAVEIFWRHGFEGASISRLLGAMNISRASMYSTYGDKNALFESALSRYHARIVGPLTEPLFDRRRPGLDALQSVLLKRVEQLLDPETPPGCLIAVASIECGREEHEPWSKQLLDMIFDFETGFYQAARRAQIDGLIDRYDDPLQIGRAMANHIQGLAVMARAGADRRSLMDMNRWIIDACKARK